MQIEEGKRYVARNGLITPPAKPQPHSTRWPWHIEGFGSYTDAGRFNGEFDDPKDLIAVAIERDASRGPEINLATMAAEAIQEANNLRAEISELRADNDAMAARIQTGDRARDDVIEECALLMDQNHKFTSGSILRRLKTKPLN